MIEDELRALLADRAGDLPANPRRTAEVRARVRTARRRRTAGAALVLVLIALAGTLITRLPGRPDALPVGVPPGPYFPGEAPVAVVPGYQDVSSRFYEFDGPSDQMAILDVTDPLSYLVVVRCERPGALSLRNRSPGSPPVEVECRQPVGDRFEGALLLDTERARAVFQAQPAVENVRFTPGSAGRWQAAVLEAAAGESLPPPHAGRAPLLDGTRSPGGGSFPVRIPARPGPGLQVNIDCAAGVALRLTVPGGTLAVADCDPLAARPGPTQLQGGQLLLLVPWADLDRVGLRPGQQVRVTVRSVGRDTDQWRVVFAG